MGRKGNWFSSVKKAFSPDSKKNQKSKKKLSLEERQPGSDPTYLETVTAAPSSTQTEELKLTDAEDEQSQNPYSVTVASAVTAGPPLAVAPPPKEVVRVVNVTRFVGKSTEEVAAIKIQTAFRGYLARRALRALRGLVRLKSLLEGPNVKRQAMRTLRSMQTLSRLQSQISSRRMRMAEENQALQKQLLQKHARELEKLQMGEEWDDSLQSKEQIEARLLSKYEAAMRRERALAYAFTHQKTWKNSSRCANLVFMDPSNPTWGWSWLERWMAAKPWESRGAMEKDLGSDHSSVKSVNRSSSVGGEISKAYARYQLNSDKISPAGSQKSGHPTKVVSPSTPETGTVTRKLKPASPRAGIWGPDDDSRSTVSVKSYRRHSISVSSVRDDESLASSPAVPSYMIPTESARAKTKLQNPVGQELNGTPEKGSIGAAKKRLSFPPSPARSRRPSVHPKADYSMNAENGMSNGDS